MRNLPLGYEWTFSQVRKYAGTHGTDELRALLLSEKNTVVSEDTESGTVYAAAYGVLAYHATELVRALEIANERIAALEAAEAAAVTACR